MSLLRKYVVVFAVLFGVLAMHGGIGSSGCSAMAMTSDGAMATGTATQMQVGATASEPSSMVLHHTPTVPTAPIRTPHSDNCSAPLPPSAAALLISLVLLGVAVMPISRLRSLRPLPRPTGREPPRPRWLDPLTGLQVLRT
jgi:hypothetical protein